ncbi:hypothetical protein FA13DRAFT_1641384, partial [Coprinellus micaceus]
KKAMDIFNKMGWFVYRCHYGMIFWVADMMKLEEPYTVQSFPCLLSIPLTKVLGKRLLIGYNIGCAFEGMIKSTTLGKRFIKLFSQCCVNTYHRYAHNFACQHLEHTLDAPCLVCVPSVKCGTPGVLQQI